MCSTDIFLGLMAVLFPPLAVWVKRGICSADSIINILLLILGYHGRVYVFVNDGGHGQAPQGYRGQQHGRQQPKQQANMNYGTNNTAGQNAGRKPTAVRRRRAMRRLWQGIIRCSRRSKEEEA
ncbi:hypothetical protein N0V88_002750 [Collariella sp. IMI 366227]|nr:hypothetical protein N0V88_002750 [Collariella sp. IMI 366227]